MYYPILEIKKSTLKGLILMTILIATHNLSKNYSEASSIINTLLKCLPDVVFLSEFNYKEHKKTIYNRLIDEGYELYLPCEYKQTLTSSCLLAIKNKNTLVTNFEQTKRPKITLSSRYITGKLELVSGDTLHLFFCYAPQLIFKDPKLKKARLEHKRNMIGDMKDFCEEKRGLHVMIAGDFNTDLQDGLDDVHRRDFNDIYEMMIDTEPNKDSTYYKKRLDYALVSSNLKNSHTILLSTPSDHKALVTRIIMS